MNNLENNFKNTFTDRLNQMKSFSSTMNTKNTEMVDLLKKIQGSPERTVEEATDDVIAYREVATLLVLMQQNVSDIVSRLIEMFTIAKISELDLGLDEKDEKFMISTAESGDLDMFRMEKGEVIIVNKRVHSEIMGKVKQFGEGELESMYKQILAVKE